jgi:hypothetical protein
MGKNLTFCLVVLLLTGLSDLSDARQKPKIPAGIYKKEMLSLQAAIQKHFYDRAAGYYRLVTDSAKREKKGDYLREYTYIWSLCALYQAANEMEKFDPESKLMKPLLRIMKDYLDPAPPKPGYSDYIMKLKPGERYYDDNQWIGITALDAYSRTHRKPDLDLGKMIFEFMMTGYDDVQGGGIYWKEGSASSKNTCSNGPGVLVALQLYLVTHERQYLDTGLKIYDWTNARLQAPSGLFWDHIRTKDGSISKSMFSYNTGTMLQSNICLYECTGESKYLKSAISLADSSLTFFYSKGKFRDNFWFNAVLLRAYQHLLKYDKDPRYIRGFKRCLDYTLQNNKNAKGLFTGKDGELNLVDQAGMLEILARFAWLESSSGLKTGFPSMFEQ